MASSFLLLWALALLSVTVEASSSGGTLDRAKLAGQAELFGSDLTNLYNSPVYLAERMQRPLDGWPFKLGDISHTGVRVTLRDGSQWLIHKGHNAGISSNTVVTDARHMSSKWSTLSTRDFQGSRTVSDFVGAGGPNYNLARDNCHMASDRMMDQ
ncbi:uncharacterized protein LOC125016898 [Mugil cephalus]|uniref:uncharacterized protein LOC125016898 n=1 Tax=Mugil cephalus TaxID=48193 RepID=UPI001FB6445D|nr:uncharacterized protein LOC125016898 [Mugil cephalus]